MKKGDKDYIKRLNLGIVLDLIRDEGPLSRADISRISSLSRSTCSLLTDELIQSGLVEERGKDASSGGRKPVLLELNYDCGLAVGLKVMADGVHGALVDFKGNAVRKQKVDADSSREGAADYLEKLTVLIRELIEVGAPEGRGPVLGIGIGISGRVDAENGILLESSILGWENVDFSTPLRKTFEVPVYVENDVNTFAVGENYFGDGRRLSNFLCLTVGRGIGLGIILDDALYRGFHHGAGELGHMMIDGAAEAPVCSCGRRGCLEAFAGDPAIIRRVVRDSGEDLSIDEIRSRAAAGDTVCREAFARAGWYLGVGLANVINFFDPQAVIIGGEGSVASDYFLPEMRRAIREHSVYGLASNVGIETVGFDDDLWVRGVATLVIREVFRIPL